MVCLHYTCICHITSHNITPYLVISIQEMATIYYNLIHFNDLLIILLVQQATIF